MMRFTDFHSGFVVVSSVVCCQQVSCAAFVRLGFKADLSCHGTRWHSVING